MPPVFFAAGFRPFFLGSGLVAALALPLWLFSLHENLGLTAAWHAHEMIYGFAAAAAGGFLLTAVPNWTGTTPPSGLPLALVFAAWLAGRIGFALGGPWAWLDLAYFPALAALLAIPLLRSKGNVMFLPLLGVYWASDIAFHLGAAFQALHGGVAVLMLMISAVGGRIIPNFTEYTLRGAGRTPRLSRVGWFERGGACGGIAVAGGLLALLPGSPVTGAVCLATFVIHAVRLTGWRGWTVAFDPLMWVLHVGYGWLVIGLGLSAVACFWPALPASAALHAITAGAIGTMIAGVMTRATLGHTGRALKVGPATVVLYALLTAGTLLRVMAPLGDGFLYSGGTLWAAGWVLFVVLYGPMLIGRRADGAAG